MSTAARLLSRASAPMRAAASGATLRGRRVRRGGAAARLAALAASARIAPSSTHCSSSRPSILARSASGSRGSRRGRLALTSAARCSAAVNGRRGPSLAPPRGPPGRPRPDGRPAPGRGRPPPERPVLDGRPWRASPPRAGPSLGARAAARRVVAGGRAATDVAPTRRTVGGRSALAARWTRGSTRGHVRRCYGHRPASAENDEGRLPKEAPLRCEIRRRPTLPGGLPPSTIGADRLNFRVRDGNGCDPVAMATEISCQQVRGRTLRTPEQARAVRSKPSAD